MGVMEKLLEEFKNLREDISNLSAAGRGGGPVLIDGKAAIGANEASELSGIGRNNLIEQVYDYLYYEKNFEVEEVYQIYQKNDQMLFAEIRIFHPSGSDEERDVVIRINGDDVEVIENNDTQKEFIKIVNDSNYQLGGEGLIKFSRLKSVELDIDDLVKRYEKSGTKEELVEELKNLDKKILKDMRSDDNG